MEQERTLIVVLTAGGPFAEVVINKLATRYSDLTVIQEQPERLAEIVRRWRRLLGVSRTIGQLAFGPMQRWQAWRARERRRSILATAGLDSTPNKRVLRLSVSTVNAAECHDALRRLTPNVVLVIGTRMIRAATLACVPAPFINYHAGLNPLYRGQYGGYWALAQGDRESFGVTVHLIDAGVDTGPTLYAATAEQSTDDTIATYHYRQLVAAAPLIEPAVEDALQERLLPRTPKGASRQWFHPTAGEYLLNGMRRGVW